MMRLPTFVHVPRTGGFAVSEAIFGRKVEHDRALDLTGWKFAFTRHPIGRFVSAFRWWKGGGLSTEDRSWAVANIGDADINEWVMETRYIEGMNLFQPMSYWINAPMAFIGRYELLAEGVQYVQRCFGLPEIPLKRLNMSSGHEALTPEAAAKLRRIYADDFKTFGYE